jgi:2-methylfumaryl-CoA isomerase
VMVVALTARQWRALREATGIAAECAALEQRTGEDLATAGGRYAVRDELAAILRPWFAARDLATVRCELDALRVTWGPYQTFRQALDEDPRVSTSGPLFRELEHPGVGRYPMPGSPVTFAGVAPAPVSRAPLIGEDTDAVLAGLLGLPAPEIASLHERGVVAGVLDIAQGVSYCRQQ